MSETEQASSKFRNDMLIAFRHGREFEYKESNGDLNLEKTVDKNNF